MIFKLCKKKKIKPDTAGNLEVLAYDIFLLIDDKNSGFVSAKLVNELIAKTKKPGSNDAKAHMELNTPQTSLSEKNDNLTTEVKIPVNDELTFQEFYEALSSAEVNISDLRNEYYASSNKFFKFLLPTFIFKELQSVRYKAVEELYKYQQNLEVSYAEKAHKKAYLVVIPSLYSQFSELIDMVSDVYLAVTVYRAGLSAINTTPYLAVTVVWLLCTLVPYLFAYSSGVQLLLNKGVFDEQTYKNMGAVKKAFLFLSLTIVGPIFFIFLHIFDIIYNILDGIFTFFLFEKTYSKWMGTLKKLKYSFGLNETEYEGFLNQRSISQLMFESLPSLILNTLILAQVINVADVINNSFFAIVLAYCTTIVNIITQLLTIKFQSTYLQEDFLNYALICMKARFGWIPFLEKIENQTLTKNVDYSRMLYSVPLVTNLAGYYLEMSCNFSDVNIRGLIYTFEIIKARETTSRRKQNIAIGKCVEDVSIHTLGQLLAAVPPNSVTIDLAGVSWEKSIENSRILGKIDTSKPKWEPLLPSGQHILKLCVDSENNGEIGLQDMFKALLRENADPDSFDTFGESLLNYAVRQNKIESIKVLLENGAQASIINISNKTCPLSEATLQGKLEIIKLLLTAKADPHHVFRHRNQAVTPFALAFIQHNAGNDTAPVEIIKEYLSHGTIATKQEEKDVLIEYVSNPKNIHSLPLVIQAAGGQEAFKALKDSNGNNHLHIYMKYITNASQLPAGLNREETVKLSSELNNEGEPPLVMALKKHLPSLEGIELALNLTKGDVCYPQNKLADIIYKKIAVLCTVPDRIFYIELVLKIFAPKFSTLNEEILKIAIQFKNNAVIDYLVSKKQVTQDLVSQLKPKNEEAESPNNIDVNTTSPKPDQPAQALDESLVPLFSSKQVSIQPSSIVPIPKHDNSRALKGLTIKSLQGTQQSHVKKLEVNLFEKCVLLILEAIALADLVGDLYVLIGLVHSRNIGWTSLTILTMVCPYLVSYAPLITFFLERKKYRSEKSWWAYLTKSLLLTPFCLVYLILLDLIFVLFTVTIEPIDLLVRLMTRQRRHFIDVDEVLNKLLQKSFGLRIMDAKGFKRLRSISQLIFESFPQIILQVRILVYGATEFGISLSGIIFSLVSAVLHALVELILIKFEANACRSSLLHYAVTSLNGRFNWVPFIEKFMRSGISETKSLEYDRMYYGLGKSKFKMDYEFSDETLKILVDSMSYLPRVDDKSKRITIRLGDTCSDASLATINLAIITSSGRVNLDVDGVNFWYIFQRDLKNSIEYPLDHTGEYLLAFYAEYDCQVAFARLLQSGAKTDIMTKKTNTPLVMFVIEKRLKRALDALIDANIDLTVVRQRKRYIEHILQTNDEELIETFLKSHRVELGNKTRLLAAEKAISFMQEGKKEAAIKLFAYAGGFHSTHDETQILPILHKKDVPAIVDWHFQFGKQLSKIVWLRLDSNLPLLKISSEAAEKFKVLRTLSEGIPMGHFANPECKGTEQDPFDISEYEIPYEEMQILNDILTSGKLPKDFSIEKRRVCDKIAEDLVLDMALGYYYTMTASLRKEGTLLLDWSEKVDISFRQRNLEVKDDQIGFSDFNMRTSQQYQFPDDCLCLKSAVLTGYLNDQGFGGSHNIRLAVVVKTKQTISREILFTVKRPEREFGDLNKTFDWKSGLDLFSIRPAKGQVWLEGYCPLWDGWSYHSKGIKVNITYFKKD